MTDATGAVTEFNQNYIAMWRVPAEVIGPKDHRQLLEITSRQLKEPDKFLTRIEEIYAFSSPETFDLLELSDGRLFERFSKIQVIGERDVGRVWSFRDISLNGKEPNKSRANTANGLKSRSPASVMQ